MAQVDRDEYERVREIRAQAVLVQPVSPVPQCRAFGSRFAAATLGAYRRLFFSRDASRCQFEPSCSRFAAQAIDRRGLLVGTLMASDRLQRCNPFALKYYPLDPIAVRLYDPVAEHMPGREVAGWGWVDRPVGNLRSPTVASLLSAILPGAGKIYAGRTADGLVSTYLIGTHAAFAADDFHRERISSVRGWMNAVLAVGFYAGGIWGSADAARSVNLHGRGAEGLPLASRVPDSTPLEDRFFSRRLARLDSLAEGSDANAALPLRYDAALTALAAYRFAECARRFAPLAAAESPQPIRARALLFESMAHAELSEWKEAERCLHTLAPGDERCPDGTRIRAAAAFAGTAARAPRLSPQKARRLSRLFPGLGQVYARHCADGAAALLINGLLVYYATHCIKTRTYPELALVALPNLLRYYRGNARGAVRCVQEYNRARDDERREAWYGLLDLERID